jgi:hypothetical protein
MTRSESGKKNTTTLAVRTEACMEVGAGGTPMLVVPLLLLYKPGGGGG